MTGVDIPRRVQLATTFIWLLAPAGLLLVLDGLWELRWWGSSSADRLLAVLADIKQQFGVEPPTLLRGHSGAWELVVLGLLTMATAAFAPAVRRGSRTARTWVYGLGIGTLAIGLAFIGSDATQPTDLHTYLADLHQGIATERIPQIHAAIYPAWYPWLEDIAQGLQVLAAALAIGMLSTAVIWHGDWFFGRRTAEPEADAWDDAITRLHQRTVGDKTDDQG